MKQPLRLMNNGVSSAAQEAGIRSVSQSLCVYHSGLSAFANKYQKNKKRKMTKCDAKSSAL